MPEHLFPVLQPSQHKFGFYFLIVYFIFPSLGLMASPRFASSDYEAPFDSYLRFSSPSHSSISNPSLSLSEGDMPANSSRAVS
jgi:hypothetical protein